MKLICTHRNADFDALASVIAANLLIPDAIPLLPRQINPNVKAFLSIHKDVFATHSIKEVQLNQVAELIVVDTNQWERLESLAVVMRMYREIVNVEAAVGIFADDKRKRCMIIGRSQIEAIDIGQIMRNLGGGGHPGAGSAVVKTDQFNDVRETILSLIRGHQPTSAQISDIMSFPVLTVQANALMENIAELIRKKGCTGMPVLENDELVGIISRRDFRKIKKPKQMKSPVKAFMSRKIISITPGASPLQAARLMVKYDVGRLPVVENGRVIGIVTRSDTMLYFYDQLPD